MTAVGMGGPGSRPDDFPEARFLRIGAGPRQLQKLKDEWESLTYEERVAENIKIASMPDGELSAKKLPVTPDVPPTAQPAENLGEAAGDQPAPSKSSTEQPR